MRFLLNANMPQSAADVLERRGHDAVHVRDTALKDAPDERVAAFARTAFRHAQPATACYSVHMCCFRVASIRTPTWPSPRRDAKPLRTAAAVPSTTSFTRSSSSTWRSTSGWHARVRRRIRHNVRIGCAGIGCCRPLARAKRLPSLAINASSPRASDSPALGNS